MKSKIPVLLALCLLCLFGTKQSFAQKKEKIKPNPTIEKMVKAVSDGKIEDYIKKLVSFGTRNTLSTQEDKKRGIGAARDWIYDEFMDISKDCGGCLEVQKQTFLQGKARRVPEPTFLTNVIAMLKGTQSESVGRTYVVSGHYDSMCSSPTDATCDAPGANDDGSGTAAVIEMARVMSKYKFDATIIFMTVAGEEQGLLGSTYFAEQAKLTNLDIEAMFTNDIIGGVKTFRNASDRNSVRVFSEGVPSDESEQEANLRRSVGGENDSPARQLARYINDVANIYSPKFRVQMIYRRDRYLRGGDHIPFLERGFPAVRITETHEDYTHQHQNVRTEEGTFYGDTIDYVDFKYIQSVARINVAALASLALAPAKPKGVGIVTSNLTNDTELKWEANREPDLAGYEIVWRETSSPVWTNSLSVGNVTTHTMKDMSKDNYFFGVRAVDRDGNKSPVVFPRPTR
ncbi:MAG: M28 family metallopeptidase [Pyrinomonadaceae bacterium]